MSLKWEISRLAQSALAWIEKPDIDSHTPYRPAYYIQVVTLIMLVGTVASGIAYTLAQQWNYVLLILIDTSVNCVILWMARHKLVKPAINSFLIFTLAFLTYSIAIAGSLHALSALIYPILIILASLLLDRKAFAVYLALCVTSAGFIVLAENRHSLPPYVPDSPSFALFFAFTSILGASALLARFITETLKHNLDIVLQREQELLTQKEILDCIGQAVVACLPDSTIYYWNKTASEYYGWQTEETLGKKYAEVIPIPIASETLAEIGTTLRNGKIWSGELSIQKRDGTLLPVLGTLAPLHDKDGHMSAWVGIAADITARKQAEATLRESEDKFKALFEYSIIGKSITQPTGEVQVNQAFCEIVGYPQEELGRSRWQDITHPDDIALTQKEVDAIISGQKEMARFTKRFIHKNGSVVWVDLSSRLRRDQNGKPLYLISSLVDITERKQAELALMESETRFHSFFNHSRDALILVDENCLVLEINPAAENLFEFQREEVLGKPIWEIQARLLSEKVQNPAAAERIRNLTELATRTGEGAWLNHLTEAVIYLPSGHSRHIQQITFTIPYGDKFRIASINRDVTDQKKTEVFRLQAETDMRTAAIRQRLLEFSRDLLATVDMAEIFQIARRAAAELVPYDVFHPFWLDKAMNLLRPAEAIYQKRVSSLFDPQWVIPLGKGIMSAVALNQQAECVNNAHLDPRSVYPEGVREKIKQEHAIFVPIHADNQVIGVLTLLRRTLPPFTQNEFELLQLLMSLVELALNNARIFTSLEQRVDERTAQLAASEERYRLISTVSSDYVFSARITAEGQSVMEWVAGAFENITGYTFEEYLAHGSWVASLHPDDRAEDARNMATLSQNQPVAADLRTITKDGQVRWVRSYARPIWDEQKNRLAGIYGAVKDITAQKQAEIREENRRMMLEKVVILGKKISGVTSLRDCLLQIYWSIRNDLGFDRVGIFLYETATRQIRGTFGTGVNGEMEDTSDYVAPVLEGDSWDTALKNPNGFYLVDNLEQKYGEIPIPAEMRGVREHCTVSAWAGETPVAFIATDNLLSQRKMPAEQMEALHLFAGYVGLAIQNARWSEDLKRRVADLDAINQVSHSLVTQPELLPLIQAVGEQIRTMFGLSVVYIALLETETNLINFYYQYQNERFIQGTQIPYGRGMTSRTMELRRPILINSNWEQESTKYDVIRDNVPPSKASLTVPLLVGEQAIGAISLQDTERENVFTDDHLRQLTIIASNLAVAIDHARLYATLQKELAERKQAEEAIRSLNAKLEQHVIERTAALAAANRELESLSYTIGHDLRSPIRAIAAYSHLLLDELAGQLEASQVDKLREVNQVAQRMGRMVDDFLAFLRLGRIAVQQRPVDVKPLVESVIAGFKDEVTGRNVDFIVQAMPPCRADLNLLQVVYTQLISNALKFTQPRNPARIEIGASEHQGTTCYYVRDNGVGFDMRYAGKLFGVFQRLHHLSEFEGTGVGLAIIHRIIHHHGGRIWAEAEVDKGATFYFTLG